MNKLKFLTLALALALVACGGGDDKSPDRKKPDPINPPKEEPKHKPIKIEQIGKLELLSQPEPNYADPDDVIAKVAFQNKYQQQLRQTLFKQYGAWHAPLTTWQLGNNVNQQLAAMPETAYKIDVEQTLESTINFGKRFSNPNAGNEDKYEINSNDPLSKKFKFKNQEQLYAVKFIADLRETFDAGDSFGVFAQCNQVTDRDYVDNTMPAGLVGKVYSSFSIGYAGSKLATMLKYNKLAKPLTIEYATADQAQKDQIRKDIEQNIVTPFNNEKFLYPAELNLIAPLQDDFFQNDSENFEKNIIKGVNFQFHIQRASITTHGKDCLKSPAWGTKPEQYKFEFADGSTVKQNGNDLILPKISKTDSFNYWAISDLANAFSIEKVTGHDRINNIDIKKPKDKMLENPTTTNAKLDDVLSEFGNIYAKQQFKFEDTGKAITAYIFKPTQQTYFPASDTGTKIIYNIKHEQVKRQFDTPLEKPQISNKFELVLDNDSWYSSETSINAAALTMAKYYKLTFDAATNGDSPSTKMCFDYMPGSKKILRLGNDIITNLYQFKDMADDKTNKSMLILAERGIYYIPMSDPTIKRNANGVPDINGMTDKDLAKYYYGRI